ncbi:MAG: DNA polymerase III subunit alpha [Caldilineaceae bacterium]|nr:DNA polymerase III subunit alpha [Caldilineaceae bacterium]MBP9071223.1 DNA polymerase III subunit alpha [Caldilineaceae bacterium]
MSGDFVHLHTHSEYSLLDGLGRVKDLVAEAKRLGHPALAITDHGAMHGAVEFFRAAKKAEIKPIIGLEAYQTVWGRPMGGRDGQFDKENYHLLMLARNMTGYRNLLKISSNSHTNGFYYKPRIDHDFLEKHAEGLIATTGCLGAEVPQLLEQGKEKEAYERLGWYVDLFGKENFYIEIQEHSIPELVRVNKILVPWADKFGLQLLVTNDIHYVKEEDGGPHDVLLCVQTSAHFTDEKRMRLSDASYFMKSRQQLEETFRPYIDLPASAYDNSLRIAEMCEVDLEDKEYHLPDMPIPDGFTYSTYLRHLTVTGLAERYGERAMNEEVQARMEKELRIIDEMGFAIYFLIVADLCDFARSRNIWWNVRGSGAGSIVAYCIGITGLDPLKNNLIFERFLNPGRVTMPDFDLDYPDDQREELIRYTVEKYGSDQVAQIVTFGRMKARAAIRDVGRVKDIPLHQVDRIAKLIPGIPGKPVTIQDVLTEGNEFYNAELVDLFKKEKWVQELLETSMQLEGVARHSGIHAAAVIVADRELSHYTPLMRGSKSSVTDTVTQYEFPILESIGLLKVDFLGLSTLSVMREAGRLIRERHGIEYKLDNMPFEGERARRAFDLLSSGEVSGVFQVESQGMRRVLTEMRPSTFEHIIATISLYRPGPIEYIPQFIRRMHGEESVEFKHKALEPILGETFAIIVYQEQIIQILSELAGYTPGEADLVRRAISKKKASEIERHKNIFIEGCAARGIPKDAATDIYADIEFFARYGFNKSHAADYAVITVQTAFLKATYPVEYMAALLLIERDKTEKVVNFISECRRMGIQVLPPDVNYSGLDFEIQEVPPDSPVGAAKKDPSIAFNFPVAEGSAIRYGMAAVKNVGAGPVQVIIDARNEGGPFKSLEEFCDRTDLRAVGKRALECLFKVGAFDRFGKRSQLLDVMEEMIARSAGIHIARDSGQLSMFDLMGGADTVVSAPIKLPDIEEAKPRERLAWERELVGVFVTSHPLEEVAANWQKVVTCSCAELDEMYNDRTVVMAGMINSLRTITTKKGDAMAFVQLEDLQGQCEVVVFPRTYAEYRDLLVPDNIILVKGKAQSREGRTTVLADSIQNFITHSSAAGDDEPPARQRPLLDVPTFNGVADLVGLGDGLDYDGLIDFVGDEGEIEDGDGGVTMIEKRDGDRVNVNGGGDNPSAPQTTPPDLLYRGTSMEPVWDDNDDFGNVPAWELFEQASSVKPGSKPASPASQPMPPQSHRPPVKPALQPSATPKAPAAPLSEPKAAAPKVPPKGTGERPEDRKTDDKKQDDSKNGGRTLHITFHRSGNLDRDKFRLKEIYERVRDPRGKDHFSILVDTQGQRHLLQFPNDPCTISDRLTTELEKHFKLEVNVE